MTAALFAIATSAFTTVVHADVTRLRSSEHGDWAATLSALQTDVRAEGRSVHVFAVDATGARLVCGHYALQLDEAAREAFTVAACNPASQATEVRLTQRSALFTHDGAVPTLRAAMISANAVAAPGEATDPARCTLAVHPWLQDVERGTRVDLTPGRFEIAVPEGVRAEIVGDHWLLRAARGDTETGPEVTYRIIDTQRHAVAFSATRSLECPSAAAESSGSPTVTAETVAPRAASTDLPTHGPAIQTSSRRDELYSGHQPGSTYDTGRSLAIAGGSLAFLSFTGAGIVLYIAMQSDVRITPELLLWTTGISGGVIVLGGVIAGIGGLLALSDRSHERPRLLGLGIGPTGPSGGFSAGATFSF